MTYILFDNLKRKKYSKKKRDYIINNLNINTFKLTPRQPAVDNGVHHGRHSPGYELSLIASCSFLGGQSFGLPTHKDYYL